MITQDPYYIRFIANQMESRVTKDECGDLVIQGKNGNIHIDGHGVCVYIGFKSGKGLNRALEALKTFCLVKQLGDTEAVVFIDSSKFSIALGRTLRKILKTIKRRKLSDSQKEQLSKFWFKRKHSQPQPPQGEANENRRCIPEQVPEGI